MTSYGVSPFCRRTHEHEDDFGVLYVRDNKTEKMDQISLNYARGAYNVFDTVDIKHYWVAVALQPSLL